MTKKSHDMQNVTSEVLVAVKKNAIYKNVTPWILEDIYHLIGVNYYLHLQFLKARSYLDYFVKEELFVKLDVTVEILSHCVWRRVVS
jgi:hypothetical protein